MTSTSKGMICPDCNLEAQPTIAEYFMWNGLIGVLLILAAIRLFFVNFFFGIISLILGIFLALKGRGKMVKMVCPRCKSVITVIKLGNYRPSIEEIEKEYNLKWKHFLSLSSICSTILFSVYYLYIFHKLHLSIIKISDKYYKTCLGPIFWTVIITPITKSKSVAQT